MKTLILFFALLTSLASLANEGEIKLLLAQEQKLEAFKFRSRLQALDEIQKIALQSTSLETKKAALESLREAATSIDTETARQAQNLAAKIAIDSKNAILAAEAFKLFSSVLDAGWSAEEAKVSAAKAIVQIARQSKDIDVDYSAALLMSSHTDHPQKDVAQLAQDFENSFLLQ